jgi:hypothetical protein
MGRLASLTDVCRLVVPYLNWRSHPRLSLRLLQSLSILTLLTLFLLPLLPMRPIIASVGPLVLAATSPPGLTIIKSLASNQPLSLAAKAKARRMREFAELLSTEDSLSDEAIDALASERVTEVEVFETERLVKDRENDVGSGVGGGGGAGDVPVAGVAGAWSADALRATDPPAWLVTGKEGQGAQAVRGLRCVCVTQIFGEKV